ncbi:MAG: Gfo/Idh/MocA family oxidoreductase [Myxococcota bacterium]|nr:Gfo/Idh/MocA family oxidoreductase [Myxococcota bacterium]
MRIGILGAAKIAPRALVEPGREIDDAEVFAVASRDPVRAERFAHEHDLARVFPSYEALCESSEIDAIYNALPISLHCEWTLRALASGKPVLCEKAFASNAREAERMAEAAAESGAFLMEAFHWRYHPMAKRMIEIVQSGQIGAVRKIHSHFNVAIEDPTNIRFDYAMGGGATMDLGCYPLHMARHVLAEEPEIVSAVAEIGPPDVDVDMRAQLRFPSGAEAEISCSMKSGAEFSMEFKAEGEQGRLHAINPLAPHGGNRLDVEAGGRKESESVPGKSTYFYQLEAFVKAVQTGEAVPTGVEDAVLNMEALDAIYLASGLKLRGLP